MDVDMSSPSLSSLKSDEAVPLKRMSSPTSSEEHDSGSEQSHLLEADLDITGEGNIWASENDKDLPLQDRGAGAWKVLIGCWILEISWGFPLSFGVFQSQYSTHPLFATSPSIPTIGALSLGFPYLILPLTTPLCLRYPHHQVHLMFLGWFMCLTSLLLASFAAQVWQLIITQGGLYGIGWCVCYTPFIIILNEWWEKKRGLAYGLLLTASGTSGLVLPFVLEGLLERWGFRITLRVYIAIYAALSAPAFWLIRPRLPPNRRTQERSKAAAKPATAWYTVLLTPSVLVITFSTFTQGLIFPYPPTFLPSYATALGLSPSAGDSLLAIRSLCQVFGLVLLGWLSDHGPAKGFAKLAVFATVWGLFASPYTVFWTRISQGLAEESVIGNGDREKGDKGMEKTMTLYSWFSLVRGITVILAGPLSEVLVGKVVVRESFGLGKWTGIVGFSVVMLFASAGGGMMWVWERW
ncbi:MFS general substrate transporter [Lentithecium fluviatile CBS 122367]|uniref:MFS general substrate transporter n=1 Tax=Lentithecium fluviatile CBS 122367 TaxID=1168545 RepID=A0A6G1ITV4_9PLEO|nr:MFS general substrate transporter [Lentithecium fluviatile CBS 122367]